jgi:hypothetical protein
MILRGDSLFSAIRAGSPLLKRPGVYVLYLDRWIVYVGKSDSDMLNRVTSHASDKRFNCALFTFLDDRFKTSVLESDLIARFLPIYNRCIPMPNGGHVERVGDCADPDGSYKATVVIFKKRRYVVRDLQASTPSWVISPGGPEWVAMYDDPPEGLVGFERHPFELASDDSPECLTHNVLMRNSTTKWPGEESTEGYPKKNCYQRMKELMESDESGSLS